VMYQSVRRMPLFSVSEERSLFCRDEEHLVRWWFSLVPGCRVLCGDGDAFIFVDAGERNRHDGPDIEDAVIIHGGEMVKGDVECHLLSGDWFHHGHSRDNRYNDVMLHLAADCDKDAITALGRKIPTVMALPQFATFPDHAGKGLLDDSEVLKRLTPFIEWRWSEKVLRFSRRLADSENPEVIFLITSFRALGYPGNEKPFEKLAKALQMERLRGLGLQEVTNILFDLSGLVGAGGMKTQREIVKVSDLVCAVPASLWRRGGVRPHAWPRRRMAFAGRLVQKLTEGWAPWSTDEEMSCKSMEDIFGKHLPGKGWTTEWLGNVVLPMRKAVLKSPNSLQVWFDLFLPEPYGRHRRHFGGRVSPRFLRNFAVGQGLIQLNNMWKQCNSLNLCPLCR